MSAKIVRLVLSWFVIVSVLPCGGNCSRWTRPLSPGGSSFLLGPFAFPLGASKTLKNRTVNMFRGISRTAELEEALPGRPRVHPGKPAHLTCRQQAHPG